jgi:biofilm PGA synthesis N-glycosyltransferase PgaC
MSVVFAIILSFYCLLLLVLLFGWVRIRRQMMPPGGGQFPGISVVVAMRNEEGNIQDLVQSLSSLAYPPDKYEVILVNDHSVDRTRELAADLVRNARNMRLVDLPQGREGKKEALAFAIQEAKFETIATTDADCSFSKNWLHCISFYFEDPGTKMVSGAVKLIAAHSFFYRLQSSEFISLIGSGAAAIGLGHPVMCNGANLAFRKEVFHEVSGYQDNIHLASGDDEFLMRKIFNRYPDGIRFMNFYEGVVSSRPQKSLNDFFHQSVRWAGKWRHNTDLVTRVLAVFILLSHLSFLGLIILNFDQPGGTLLPVFFKIFLEGVFFSWVSRFLDRGFDIVAFLVWQFLYPIYVTIIGLSSLTRGYEWKSRNYRQDGKEAG